MEERGLHASVTTRPATRQCMRGAQIPCNFPQLQFQSFITPTLMYRSCFQLSFYRLIIINQSYYFFYPRNLTDCNCKEDDDPSQSNTNVGFGDRRNSQDGVSHIGDSYPLHSVTQTPRRTCTDPSIGRDENFDSNIKYVRYSSYKTCYKTLRRGVSIS